MNQFQGAISTRKPPKPISFECKLESSKEYGGTWITPIPKSSEFEPGDVVLVRIEIIKPHER